MAILDICAGQGQLLHGLLQKTSLALLAFLYPLWWLAWKSFLGLERHKYRTLSPENETYVKTHGAGKLLTGRTIVVSAIKGQPEKMVAHRSTRSDSIQHGN